jgi:hypothetical protein
MLARTKQPVPPTLTEQIRRAAAAVRELDAEVKRVIDLYIDEQRLGSGASLPRGTHEQILMGRYREPWYAILGLERERANEQ